METTPGVEATPTTTESTESPASDDARPATRAAETPPPTPAVAPPPTTEAETSAGDEARPTEADAEGVVAVEPPPGPHDVLLGRGGGTNHHVGNVRFRRLTESSRARYAASSRNREKAAVAAAIVRGWRAQDPPGRFLQRRKDGPTGMWFDVGDEKAIRKTSQALREKMKYALTGGGGKEEAGRQSDVGGAVDGVPMIPPLLAGDSPFAPEEDTLIKLAVEISDGAPNWDRLAERKFPLRTGALLRERWANHLDPDVDRSPFSREDDKGMHRAVDELGPKWKDISDKYFLGKRSEDQLEIRYKSEVFLRLAEEGFPEDDREYAEEKSPALVADEEGRTEKTPSAYSRRTETDRLLSAPVRLSPSSVAAAVAAEKETASKALDEDEEMAKIHTYIQNRLAKAEDKQTGDKKTRAKMTEDKKGRKKKKKDKRKKSKKKKKPRTNVQASEREALPPEKKCEQEGCNKYKAHLCMGYCMKCYRKLCEESDGNIEDINPRPKKVARRICAQEGCNSFVNGGDLFCGMHNRNRMRWQKHFDELAEHFQRNGANAPIPKENTELKSWVYSQQVNARNNNLDADKLNLLKDIGLNFDSKWQQRYKDLAEHYERNGAGAKIPTSNRNLSSWATKQRASYKSNKLDETQVSMLRNIGFEFTLLEREGNAGLWENCYERITKYISEHGTLPPAGTDDPDEKRSRMWFFDQKIKMKKGKLLEEKLERFKQIIDTAEEGNGEEVFAKMFDRLSDYSRNHGGDANILSNSDWQGGKRLYNWAKYQRNLFKKGALDKDKATRLRSIGLDLTFDTTSDRWNTFWEKNYANLVEYKMEHGHCLVPSIYKTERHGPLGRWVSDMKVAATTGKLSNYRMTKLMELGLDFRSNHQAKKFNDRWEHRLRQLAEYKMANEGRDPPRSAETIGPWCSLQRRKYRRGELEQDRMSKLLSIGFDFSIGRDEAKVAEEKAEEKKKETDAPPKKRDGSITVLLSDRVKMSLLESIKSGKPVQPPSAASEVYFDIEDPPEFYEPSSLVTLHPMSQLGEHDAVFSEDGKLDCSHEGSVRFRELLSEFQPTYKTTHQLRRRAVAKSVTYIVRNRGGRFFGLNGVDEYFHELRDEEVNDKTVFILGRGLNARAITDELRKLEAKCTGLNGGQEDFSERLDSIKASIAPGQESSHWVSHFNVLNTYVLQHGRPPQTREECPPLYDWIQLQKERQNQLENMFRFC